MVVFEDAGFATEYVIDSYPYAMTANLTDIKLKSKFPSIFITQIGL